jgi:hypothetical protein
VRLPKLSAVAVADVQISPKLAAEIPTNFPKL